MRKKTQSPRPKESDRKASLKGNPLKKLEAFMEEFKDDFKCLAKPSRTREIAIDYSALNSLNLEGNLSVESSLANISNSVNVDNPRPGIGASEPSIVPFFFFSAL